MTGDGDRSSDSLPAPVVEQAALLAHQFRGPLAGIQTAVEALARGYHGSLAPAQREAIDGIGRRCRELDAAIEALTTLYALDADPGALDLQPVDIVAAVIAPVVGSPERRDNAKGMTLRIAAGGPVVARCDARLLAVALGNLVDNALRYGKPGTIVLVSAQSAVGTTTIGVRSEGVAIAAAEASRLFRPFARLRQPGTEGTSGTGLGLFLCRRIVEVLGGTVSVASGPAGLTEFRITLPAAA